MVTAITERMSARELGNNRHSYNTTEKRSTKSEKVYNSDSDNRMTGIVSPDQKSLYNGHCESFRLHLADVYCFT